MANEIFEDFSYFRPYCVSYDGKVFAVLNRSVNGRYKDSVKVYDTLQGVVIKEIPLNTGDFYCVAIDSHNHILAVGLQRRYGKSREIVLYDYISGNEVRTLHLPISY